MECTLCREECENMSHVFSIYIIESVDSVSRQYITKVGISHAS